MIIELLLVVIIGIFDVLIALIPQIEWNPVFLSGFDSVAWLFVNMSYVVPMGVFASCLSVFFLLHNITFVIGIINWVIRKIPGIS